MSGAGGGGANEILRPLPADDSLLRYFIENSASGLCDAKPRI